MYIHCTNSSGIKPERGGFGLSEVLTRNTEFGQFKGILMG
jgi:hypothetical protein